MKPAVKATCRDQVRDLDVEGEWTVESQEQAEREQAETGATRGAPQGWLETARAARLEIQSIFQIGRNQTLLCADARPTSQFRPRAFLSCPSTYMLQRRVPNLIRIPRIIDTTPVTRFSSLSAHSIRFPHNRHHSAMSTSSLTVKPYGGGDAKIRNVEPMKEGKVRDSLVSTRKDQDRTN